MLIQHGADIEFKNKEDGSTGLQESARWANPLMLNLYLKLGANINTQDHMGNTPLMKSIDVNADINLIMFFLNNGADVHIKNKNGKTALDLANKNLNELSLKKHKTSWDLAGEHGFKKIIDLIEAKLI